MNRLIKRHDGSGKFHLSSFMSPAHYVTPVQGIERWGGAEAFVPRTPRRSEQPGDAGKLRRFEHLGYRGIEGAAAAGNGAKFPSFALDGALMD
jgi:hypothetical protein